MPSENTRRIAKNTGFLYMRMLLTMGVAFYTSRVVLNALGVEDYGIYNVVGGVVAMFSFLTGMFTSATQRFLNYEMGLGNQERLKDFQHEYHVECDDCGFDCAGFGNCRLVVYQS